MKEIKQEWAKEILGQAIAEVKTKEDIERVTKEVEGTPVGINKDYMEAWRDLIKMKQEARMIK